MMEMSQPAATAPAIKQATKKPPTGPAPRAKKIALYHIDMCDTSIITYYQEDDISYTKVAVYVNGVIPKGTYHFLVELDGMSILWW